MAGMKNRSGGSRPGAGRPPKPVPTLEAVAVIDPKPFLLGVMNDNSVDARLRIDAAKALLPFMHQKIGEGGKKEGKIEAAKKVSSGKFSPSAPPKLKLIPEHGR